MRVRCIGALLMVSASLLAQSPPPCPANDPVDDIIAAIKDAQAPHKHRNKNPLPQNICILGWCRGTGGPPGPAPKPEKGRETAGSTTGDTSAGDTSSSKSPADLCRAAMERAVAAAHDVEVGDFYFEKGSYQAALGRYQDAAEQKPGDAAIHVRLGRVYEKLNQPQEAINHYEMAEKLTAPEKWTEEARTAVARLQHRP